MRFSFRLHFYLHTFFQKKWEKVWLVQKKCLPLHPLNENNGAIAQLVEQRTENPCVPGSIPGGTTLEKAKLG